ncbi:uncharacterized protein LOC122506257 isoform X1 [Leptopilina heterotoma]|uniref:uncharacterized protein LOC122506257 isoform X1 n=1 Tax=Leptopilina heterotoma TaxID=63436 RepID=UPI001CA99876|nr:uncharacterized protein LOC122506257 isoform X1 [Leptopilina heterotoma]
MDERSHLGRNCRSRAKVVQSPSTKSSTKSKANDYSPKKNNVSENSPKRAKTTSWSDVQAFRENIAKSLSDIKFMLNIQNEKIDKLHEKHSESAIFNERFLECQSEVIQKHVKKDRSSQFHSQFPVATLDNLQKIEDKLTLPEYRNDMISFFGGFGGIHVKETTYTVMKYAFTNAIGSLFDWLGLKNKLKFSDLHLTTVIMETVRQSCRVKEIEVIEAIKDWLRHAPARHLRESENNKPDEDGEHDGENLYASDQERLSINLSDTEGESDDPYMDTEINFQNSMHISDSSNHGTNSPTIEIQSDKPVEN